jgi:hypothetical protein
MWHITNQGRLIGMGRHESKITGNGQGELDLSKTKDVRDSGSGQHSIEDRGGKDDKDEDKE